MAPAAAPYEPAPAPAPAAAPENVPAPPAPQASRQTYRAYSLDNSAVPANPAPQYYSRPAARSQFDMYRADRKVRGSY